MINKIQAKLLEVQASDNGLKIARYVFMGMAVAFFSVGYGHGALDVPTAVMDVPTAVMH